MLDFELLGMQSGFGSELTYCNHSSPTLSQLLLQLAVAQQGEDDQW